MRKAFWIIFILVGCSSSDKKENKANEHMHKSSFEDLVARFESPERGEWQKPEAVIAFLDFEKDETIADVGAGTGYFSFPIAKKVEKVIATDIDERFLQYINEHNQNGLNVETRLSEEDRADLDDREVNRVLMVNVAHHLNKRAKYFNRLRKNIKVGGELIIIDFKPGELPVGPPASMKVSAKEMTRELALAGYRKVDIDSTLLDYQYIFRAY